MKLGSFKRIISTDYKEEEQPLIEKISGCVNDSTEEVYLALDNRLTFDDNFSGSVKDVEVTVGANGNPVNRTSIVLNTATTVRGTFVMSAVNKSNSSVFPTSSPFISFTQSGNLLFIDNVTGLQPNSRYLIRLVALN